MSDNKDLGVDVSKARFWSNAKMTIEIPMPDKDVVEQVLGYVPIVRCDACSWWTRWTGSKIGYCKYLDYFCAEDFFCKYGERAKETGDGR